ncbi:hypothetical protein GCM10023340_37300 [Nocardioides marinquilinus]|uniref:Glycosyltransferase n=1 Tax=Nocardioides marinquilinus TaxID=1210400 RepID=A0ABP9PZD9_9ACTN
MSAPAHLVVAGTARHGVSLLATQLADRLGAPVVDDLDEAAALPAVHVHLTDTLFGRTPGEAAGVLRRLCGSTRVTLTLHDVPQPTDGDGFARRRACYADVLGTGARWATSSRSERLLVERWCAPGTDGAVVPLPVVEVDAAPQAAVRPGPVPPGDATIGVLGWVYPGKGHELALAVAARLGTSAAERPRVVALGAVAPGHDDLAEHLRAEADRLGVRLEISGWLDDAALTARAAAVDVPLAGHRNVSASGSINSWLTVGRRPLVRACDYTREMAGLRPGTLELFDAEAEDDPASLVAQVAARLRWPELGVVADGALLRPTLDDVAGLYRAWWAS